MKLEISAQSFKTT